MRTTFLTFILCSTLLSGHLPKPVPLTLQPNNYTCGPASFHSVLQYWELSTPGVMELAKELQTKPFPIGTAPEDLERAGHEHGLLAQLEKHLTLEELKSAIDSGETVIVRWYPTRVSHYCVVTGFTDNSISMMNPMKNVSEWTLDLRKFQSRWLSQEGETVAIRYTGK